MVPERRFGMALLTNSDRSPKLLAELFTDDWALRRFAGVSNLPATPRERSAAELAPFEGVYRAEQIGFTGPEVKFAIEMKAKDGALSMAHVGDDSPPTTLTFYKEDYVIVEGIGARANFLRNPDGTIAWFRLGGACSAAMRDSASRRGKSADEHCHINRAQVEEGVDLEPSLYDAAKAALEISRHAVRARSRAAWRSAAVVYSG